MRPQVEQWPLGTDQVHFDVTAKEDQSPAPGQVIVKQFQPLFDSVFLERFGRTSPSFGSDSWRKLVTGAVLRPEVTCRCSSNSPGCSLYAAMFVNIGLCV